MAIKLNYAINQPEVRHQGITGFRVTVPHNYDGSDPGNPEILINKAKVKISYDITTWNKNGEVVGTETRTVPASDWPQVFRQDVRSVYLKLQLDAQNNNLIGEGTDEPL